VSRFALEDAADFVIVGTGAGGATAARVLVEAGHSVVMVEEGPFLRPQERARALLPAMEQSLRDLATITTSGLAPIPLLLGRCVGGSTAVNSGIIWRLPEAVRRTWVERFGLGALVEEHALDRAFSRIERELGVTEVDASVRGGNAERMRRAAETLGLPGRFVRRNAPTCRGSARCLQGCPHGARQGMDVAFVPHALALGARLHTHVRVERVETHEGRAHAVVGDLLPFEGDGTRGRARIAAHRGVILAAGAIHTPVVLRRTGLGGLVGEHYQTHPGAAVVGLFDEQVGMGFGVTQAFDVPMPARGFKLESLSLPPELLASRIPGAGDRWQRALHKLDYLAQWCAVVRMHARGRVRPGWGDAVRVRYEPTPRDVERLKEGVALLVRMMFAAGAREVYPGVAGLPEVFDRPEQAEWIRDARVQRRDFHLMASHHFGTACAGKDPSRSVVGPDLQSHDVRGLYVLDGSVFPTNLGVNPQHSIMAIAFRAAEDLASLDRRRAAA
jgi:choline dehydrogenase-like flavoprotein